jgi:hypothetical protein
MSIFTIPAYKITGRRFLAVLMVVFLSFSFKAYCWYGGYCNTGCGYWENGGWCGTGIPNGLGWTLFGLEAASAIALPAAIADSELNSGSCYAFDGNIACDEAAYCDPYVSYGAGYTDAFSTSCLPVIGLGYPLYPFYGFSYGWGWGGNVWGGGSGYCYNGWHGYQGCGYGGGYGYYSGIGGGMSTVIYSRGNNYFAGTVGGAKAYDGFTSAGSGSYQVHSNLEEAEQNYHHRIENQGAVTFVNHNASNRSVISRGSAYGGLTPAGSSNYQSHSNLAEAEQNYHMRFENQTTLSGLSTHRSSLAEAEQNYHPTIGSHQPESVSKSHRNASRYLPLNNSESHSFGTSARNESGTDAHPGFDGINPLRYMKSTVASGSSVSQFSSSRSRGPSSSIGSSSLQNIPHFSSQNTKNTLAVGPERVNALGLTGVQQIPPTSREIKTTIPSVGSVAQTPYHRSAPNSVQKTIQAHRIEKKSTTPTDRNQKL